MASIQDNNTIIIYRVGPVLCCAPCISVVSITHPAPLTKLPGQQSRHAGIFKFGTHLVNVCELRTNFGVDPKHWLDPGRLIIVELSSGYVAFWVDEIIDVTESPGTGWGNPPPLIPKSTFSKTLTLKDEIHLYTEFENIYAIKQIGYLKPYIEHLNKIKDEKVKKATLTTTAKNKIVSDNSSKDNTNNIIDNSPSVKSKNKVQNTEIQSSDKNKPITSDVTVKSTVTNDDNILPAKKHPSNSNTVIPNESKNTLANTTPQKSVPNRKDSLFENINKKPVINQSKNKVPGKKSKTENISTLKSVRQSTTVSLKNKTPSTKKTKSINDSKFKKFNTSNTTSKNKISNSTTNSEVTKKVHEKKYPESMYSYNNDDNEQSFIWIFIGIIIVLISGGYFYIQYDNKPIPEIILTSSVNSNIDSKIQNITTDTVTATDHFEQGAIIRSNRTNEPIESLMNQENTKNSEIKSIDHEDKSATTTDSNKSDYSADVSKNSDGVTITLHTRLSDEEFTSLKEKTELNNNISKVQSEPKTEVKTDTKTENNTQIEIVNKIQTDDIIEPKVVSSNNEVIIEKSTKKDNDLKITIKTPIDENVSPSTITKEIIHIVVKGDTLWHIAKFYVDDPFRYPELARLSNIKNPDLIYPGNRVHIIQIYTNGHISNE